MTRDPIVMYRMRRGPVALRVDLVPNPAPTVALRWGAGGCCHEEQFTDMAEALEYLDVTRCVLLPQRGWQPDSIDPGDDD